VSERDFEIRRLSTDDAAGEVGLDGIPIRDELEFELRL
jgi:hypothetical protein